MTPADSRDPHDLDRFVAAQDAAGTFDRALAELRAGHKTGHWIWFVFPQLEGLGQSHMSRTYAIRSLAEARAYLRHPVLGPRLAQCAEALVQLEAHNAERVFGPIDAVKLRSCMTLFGHAAEAGSIFRQVLDLFFDGRPDPLTERALAAGPGGRGGAGEGEPDLRASDQP
ncbi:MAG TPA: DUF1810 domain-containing protein [Streptosporangiaceae bacterium]|nr:DUF1810 domain-containing protein [Streptosporangiaceae bacterium]